MRIENNLKPAKKHFLSSRNNEVQQKSDDALMIIEEGGE